MERPTYHRLVLTTLILLAATSFILYNRSLHFGFQEYDDRVYVLENPRIKNMDFGRVFWIFTHPYFNSYCPLTLLAHAAVFSIWQKNPFGHHLTNLVLHTANTILVFLLSLRLLEQRTSRGGDATGGELAGLQPSVSTIAGSAFSAFLFSVHPLHVEPVAWISGLKDLLMTLFGLGTYLTYDRARRCTEPRHARWWYASAFACFILALLSKSAAVFIPAVLFMYEVLLMERISGRAGFRDAAKRTLPFWSAAALAGGAAVFAGAGQGTQHAYAGLALSDKVLSATYSFAVYLGKMIWPAVLTPLYDIPGRSSLVTGTVVFVALSVVCILSYRRSRWPLLAWGHFAFALVPTSVGVALVTGIQPWADRYTYFPTVALFICAGGALTMAWRRGGGGGAFWPRPVIAVVAVLLVVGYGARALSYEDVWMDSNGLWSYAVEVSPGVAKAHANLGAVQAARGESAAAMASFVRAIVADSSYAPAYRNIGLLYQARGALDSAGQMFRKAISLEPLYAGGYTSLGYLYLQSGRPDSASAAYSTALHLDPSSVKTLFNLGVASALRGDRAAAAHWFRETIALDPTVTDAYLNLGVISWEEGNRVEAVESLKKAALLGSGQAQSILTGKGIPWR
jgi:Tfp pilus assembly protein PilF